MKALVTTLTITLISFVAFSQKLPFQGQLIENGTPVTGTRDFVFNIPDGVGGSLWTETHIGVQVQDGLYSLVLGDVATLPDQLFSDVSERTLEITVGATSLSPITLYAGIKEWKFTKEMDGSTDRPAILGEISGPASNWAAIEGYASTDGDNYGVYGQGEGTGKVNAGLYGYGLGAGDGSVTDFQGTFGSYNYGAIGIAKDNLNGNIGVWGKATGNAGAADNIGVVGWSEISGGVENRGVLGWAKGTGVNKGLVGMATGGSENWAGWFDGDVKISGTLHGQNLGSINPNGAGSGQPDWRVFVAPNYYDGNFDNGLVAIYGPRDDGEGRRASLGSYGPNSATSYGQLELHGYQGQPKAILSGSNQAGNLKMKDDDGTETVVLDAGNGSLTLRNADGSQSYMIDYNGVAGNGHYSVDQNSSTSEEITALKAEVSGTGVWDGQGAGITEYSGILGIGSAAEGGNAGVRGIANVSANSASFHYGVYGISRSTEANSTAVIYGLRGEALGQSSFSVGVRGISNNSAAGGANFGGDFSANDNPGQNVGLRGRAQGDGAQTSENIGVSGVSTSNNSAKNIGVYGTASSASGENWAGFFEGDVKVTGTLSVDGQGGSISATGINQDYGNFGEKNWETGLQGYLDLRGDAEAGKDNIRIALGVEKAGSETVGSFSLFGPVYNDVNCTTCPRSFVSAYLSNDPGGNAPTEWSGNFQLSGQESPNVIIGGQNYQDSDLGHLSLFGNKPDGNGWFYSHAGLQVNQDGSQEWGSLRLEANDGVSNVEIGAKSWEDPTNGAGRPYFRMRGNTPDQDLVWMEVADDGLGNELGAVSFNGTDGANLRIDANGLSGDIKNIHMKRATLQSQWGNDGQGALDLRDANDQSRALISVSDDGAANYTGSMYLSHSANGSFVDLNAQWGIRSTGLIAVAQSSTPGNNSIEMGDNGDAGFLNINNTNNENEITLNGLDGSINVKNGLVNVATGENNGNTSGTVNLGATSAGHGLRMYGGYDFDSDGNVRSHIALDGPGSYVYLWGDGSVNASNSVSAEGDMFATNFNTTSDGRLKENITPIEHSLANTLKLRGVSYNWLDKSKSQSRQIGVIAQEVEEVYPEFVHTNEEGMKSVNYSQMVAVLIEAIKELNTQIETLKTENASLKTELATAKNNEKRITELEASVKSLVNLLQAPSKQSDENSISLGKQE
ncbi:MULTISPECIES: tail fiber domain-containing protein [unclassified Imperialibacter]|uniref:tail fiber domain-containing protein n=1 Tax=unclassified Imperialibacter TaxID=2629706 RepID=UPI00125EC87B|nr:MULTISPECIES: tail fiber domain-containing protein [unclassified Imperialibacter]